MNDTRMIFMEFNEAEQHFLRKFADAGLLPNFSKMMREGAFIETSIADWKPEDPRSWREICPWIIWPTLYTGLSPKQHSILAFGQDTAPIQGRCLWDVLDKHGYSVGVFGSLLSYPPRNHGNTRFYIPESLADDATCFPESARALQEFAVFSSRNYSGGLSVDAVRALGALLRSTASGIKPATIARLLLQIPREKVLSLTEEPRRAMLAGTLVLEGFTEMYERYRPAFASMHSNHIAYMQHRYWRATEPERFSDELSDTDKRFFSNVNARRKYELKMSKWIERSFQYADQMVGKMMTLGGPDVTLVVATALGQKPFDPGKGEIFNPVVRLVNERELFDALGLKNYRVLHQMNPDVTVTLESEDGAKRALEVIDGLTVVGGERLFFAQRRGKQVLLEMEVPKPSVVGKNPMLKDALGTFQLPMSRFVQEHPSSDQSTAQHRGHGWVLAWNGRKRIQAVQPKMPVEHVAGAVLSLFNIPPQEWMPATPAAFAVTA